MRVAGGEERKGVLDRKVKKQYTCSCHYIKAKQYEMADT